MRWAWFLLRCYEWCSVWEMALSHKIRDGHHVGQQSLCFGRRWHGCIVRTLLPIRVKDFNVVYYDETFSLWQWSYPSWILFAFTALLLSSWMSELCSLTGIFWMVVFVKQPEGFDDPHIAKRNMSPTMGLWIKANFSELWYSIEGLSQVAWLSHHWRFALCIPEVSGSHAVLLSLYVVNVWMKHWHS